MILEVECPHARDYLLDCDSLGCTDEQHNCEVVDTICRKTIEVRVNNPTLNFGRSVEVWHQTCDCPLSGYDKMLIEEAALDLV